MRAPELYGRVFQAGPVRMKRLGTAVLSGPPRKKGFSRKASKLFLSK